MIPLVIDFFRYSIFMIPQVDLFAIIFLEELKTHKKHFEIYWPLASEAFVKVLIFFYKICIIRLDHICFEKSCATFWQVRCCAHRTRHLSKVRRRFFQNLWPSQKTQTLPGKCKQKLEAKWDRLKKCYKQRLFAS